MNEAMLTWMCEIHFAKSGRSTGFGNLAVFLNVHPSTWREQHSSTEQRHLLLRHLYAAQAFGQVKHGVHEVVAACGTRQRGPKEKAVKTLSSVK